jgi:hypothetical protein
MPHLEAAVLQLQFHKTHLQSRQGRIGSPIGVCVEVEVKYSPVQLQLRLRFNTTRLTHDEAHRQSHRAYTGNFIGLVSAASLGLYRSPIGSSITCLNHFPLPPDGGARSRA